MIGFLAARATPGVEVVEAGRYQRTIAIGSATGTIAIAPADEGSALMLEVRFGDPRALLAIVERVRRMFDLGADPAVIAGQLSGDALLRRAVAAHAGIRTPGAWDAFEITVRAILGQQISVKAATTMAGRVAERWGTQSAQAALASGPMLTHLFPTPEQLADAPLEEAGIISLHERRPCGRWRAPSVTAASCSTASRRSTASAPFPASATGRRNTWRCARSTSRMRSRRATWC